MSNRGAEATAALNLLIVAGTAGAVWEGHFGAIWVGLIALGILNVAVLAICFWEMAERHRRD